MFAEVIVNINNENVDKKFTYKIKEKDVAFASVGKRCIVPFGKGDKEVLALIVKLKDFIDFDEKRCKYISKIVDTKPVITRSMINLAYLMSKKYYCTFNECLKLCMPKNLQVNDEYVVVLNKDFYDKSTFRFNNRQKEIINYLMENNFKVAYEELIEVFGVKIDKEVSSLKKNEVVSVKNIGEVKDLQQKVDFLYINYGKDNIDEILDDILKKRNKQSEVLNLLLENDNISVRDVVRFLGISKSPINTLIKNEIAYTEKIVLYRNPDVKSTYKGGKIENYTEEQQKAIDFIGEKIQSGVYEKPTLIFGVTGSGKTEIYMKLVEMVIRNDEQGIVLVPEIALTSQLVSIFRSRFGDVVSFTHSKLSLGERLDQFERAKKGDIKVIVGARSALFTPFLNLGIVIIDEEHDSSFRSNVKPMYSTMEVAMMRGKIENAQVVLGSATPKVTTYYKALQGEIDLVTLENRVNNSYPLVNIVDMREELIKGNKSMFSSKLIELIANALNNDEQIILFINKRGFSSFVNCRSCGEVIKCPSCDVAMTYHARENKLRCHYCNRTRTNPKNCPICASKYIKHFGVGTQKVADEIRKIFPDEKVIRMDQDTTKNKNAHQLMIEDFRNKRASFLVGTQMIAKGLDFENVTVVGVVAGDLSLHSNGYLAGEMTFSLLTQVAGRAGRGSKKGEVVIQSYNPEHYAFIHSKTNNYLDFYKEEIAFREISDNPPFTNNFFVYATSIFEKNLIEILYKLVDIMVQYKEELIANSKYDDIDFEIIGPAPTVISKIRRRYRWRILVKGKYEKELTFLVKSSISYLKSSENCEDINFSLNLNPENIQ
ncbi:MAG: primosomal protein N' [Lachnospirales bacterium]